MHIDDQENISDSDVILGKIDGFKFIPSENFKSNDSINDYITEKFIHKIDQLINDGDSALSINAQFNIIYKNSIIAHLLPTPDILKPDFQPIIDERIQAIPLARLALHIESWLKRQINPLTDAIDVVKNTEGLSENSHDFLKAITNELGYCTRYKINNAVKKVTPDDRTKLRKNGVRFAQYSVFIKDILKPAIQKIKLILWALHKKITFPEMPPSGVVTIPVNHDAPDGYYDIAGYKVCGDFAVRGDMIEKLADNVRNLAMKTDENPNGEFEVNVQHMSFVGKSGDAFDVILKSLGYDFRLMKVIVTSAKTIETSINITETTPENIIDNNTAQDAISNNEVVEDKPVIESTDTNPSSDLDNRQVSQSNVEVTEQEIEKKIWFWSPPVKQSFKNTKKPSIIKNGKTEDTDTKNQKKFKKKPNHSKKPHSESNNHTKPHTNTPKKHKIALENNPFAALQQLKDKKL